MLCECNVCVSIGVCIPWWTSSAVCVCACACTHVYSLSTKSSASHAQFIRIASSKWCHSPSHLADLNCISFKGEMRGCGKKGTKNPTLARRIRALRAPRVVTVWLSKHITSCSVLCSPACAAGAKRLRKNSPWRKSSPAWSSKLMITDMTTSVPAINTAPLEGKSIHSLNLIILVLDRYH